VGPGVLVGCPGTDVAVGADVADGALVAFGVAVGYGVGGGEKLPSFSDFSTGSFSPTLSSSLLDTAGNRVITRTLAPLESVASPDVTYIGIYILCPYISPKS